MNALPPSQIAPKGAGWVEVVNPHPVSNLNVTYQFGDSCNIDPGDIITLLAQDGDKVLVEITATNGEAGGTSCPSRTLFFMDADVYTRLTVTAWQQEQDDARTKEHVNALLGSLEGTSLQAYVQALLTAANQALAK